MISGVGGVGIKGDIAAVVTLKDVEATGSTRGIVVQDSNITAVLDIVFSCGNSNSDTDLSVRSTITKWDITCNHYIGFA
jgi:hypothetical protein